MRTLKFKLAAQVIEKDGDFSNIVSGTSNYLEAAFAFSDEWRGCKKVASFLIKGKEYAAPLFNNRCRIPSEVLTGHVFRVKVTGKRHDGYIIRSNAIKISQED